MPAGSHTRRSPPAALAVALLCLCTGAPLRAQDGTPPPASPYHLASTLLQAHVVADSNQTVAAVRDIVCDRKVGLVQYAVLDAGHFIEVHEPLVAVPIDLLKDGHDPLHVRLVGVREETLQQAPSFPGDRWPRDTDRDWIAMVWRHFDHPPYWDDPATGKTPKEQARGFSTVRLAPLLRRPLPNTRGITLGKIDDFVVDTTHGKILYVLVKPAAPAKAAPGATPAPGAPPAGTPAPAGAGKPDRHVAVPWWALVTDIQGSGIELDMEPVRLRSAPDFQATNWASMSNGKWIAVNNDFFALRPDVMKKQPPVKPPKPTQR